MVFHSMSVHRLPCLTSDSDTPVIFTFAFRRLCWKLAMELPADICSQQNSIFIELAVLVGRAQSARSMVCRHVRTLKLYTDTV